jgi:hypothetical protein
MRTTNFIRKSKYVVLLIGASRYITNKYSDIPNVETNVEELKKLFLDPRYIGVNERNIIISLNEDSKSVKRKITDATEMAKNPDYTLFVYYSGHGIINPANYKLYFATSDMDVNYLDSDAIDARVLLEKISRSAASRKILVVDACHSGGIHNTMGGDAPETTLMKDFEGVHFVSACDEDSTALFPKKKPNAPTYFTGALINRIHLGMDIDRPYLTLREIVDDIRYDFKHNKKELPLPQQSSVLNADQMPFALNVVKNNTIMEHNDVVADVAIKNHSNEIDDAWTKTCKENSVVAYYNFVDKFPKSKYTKVAENKIIELEEDEKWIKTENIGTLIAYMSYKKAYPMGRYLSQANVKIAELKNHKKDNDMWNTVCSIDTLDKYKEYVAIFPKGNHTDEAISRIKQLAKSRKSSLIFLLISLVLCVGLVLITTNTTPPSEKNNNMPIVTKVLSDTDTVKVKTNNNSSSEGQKNNTSSAKEFKKMSYEQKADDLKKAGSLYYNTALMYYDSCLVSDPENYAVKVKRLELVNLIDSEFNKYIKIVDNLIKCRGLDDDIEHYINLAAKLKSNDDRLFELVKKYNAMKGNK